MKRAVILEESHLQVFLSLLWEGVGLSLEAHEA